MSTSFSISLPFALPDADELVPLLARTTAVATLTYWVMLAFLGKNTRIPIKQLALVHYTLLIAVSAVTFAGAMWAAVEKAMEDKSIEGLACVREGGVIDRRLYFWMVIFHATKYVELLDTTFPIWKGTGFSRFQAYHHTVVMWQTLIWLATDFALGIFGTIANSFVHIVMYYFYLQGSQGVRVSWKRHVTQVQIVQFIFSLGLYAFYVYLHFTVDGGCKGFVPSIFSIVFNVSLLMEFTKIAAKRPTKDDKLQ
eukprot:Opistho-2@41005